MLTLSLPASLSHYPLSGFISEISFHVYAFWLIFVFFYISALFVCNIHQTRTCWRINRKYNSNLFDATVTFKLYQSHQENVTITENVTLISSTLLWPLSYTKVTKNTWLYRKCNSNLFDATVTFKLHQSHQEYMTIQKMLVTLISSTLLWPLSYKGHQEYATI